MSILLTDITLAIKPEAPREKVIAWRKIPSPGPQAFARHFTLLPLPSTCNRAEEKTETELESEFPKARAKYIRPHLFPECFAVVS
jgi:hypothetical protein